MNADEKQLSWLRRRAYQEGQYAKVEEVSPYFPNSTLDQAWKEGHKDVHFYGISKFHPTAVEKVALFVGFITVVIATVSIVGYLVRN